MNNENKNLNAGRNGHVSGTGDQNQVEVEQFIEALETERLLVDSLNEQSRGIAEFGSDIRQSADLDLPLASESLREMLVERLDVADDRQSSVPIKEKPHIHTTRWFTPGKMATAACFMLAATLSLLLLPMMIGGEKVVEVEHEFSELGDNWDVSFYAEPSVGDNSNGRANELDVQFQEATSGLDGLSNKSGYQEFGDRNGKRFEAKRRTEAESESAPAPKPAAGLSTREMSEQIFGASVASNAKAAELAQRTVVQPVPLDSKTQPSSSLFTMNSPAPSNQQSGQGGEYWERKNAGWPTVEMLNGQVPATSPQKQSTRVKLAYSEANVSPSRLAKIDGKREAIVESLDSFGFRWTDGVLPSQSNMALVDGRANGLGGGGFGGGGGGRGGRGRSRSSRHEWYGRGYYREADTGGEQYEPIHENSFIAAKGQKALSTFSIDVDTASYSNMRRFLNNHQVPPRNSIRIEELVNYFEYDYPQPQGDVPFSVNMEMASCPWNDSHHLLRVGLKGKEIHREERSPSNLVFLLDVSGSMNSPDKLPLLKKGISMMVQRLSENDTVSIVTYAGNAGVVLEPTNGANKEQILQAIDRLNSGGSTNGSAGINMAYELAQKQFIKDGANRVILATDGDLNVGVTSNSDLVKLIKTKASEGVFLTVLGFGTGNLKDAKLEQLADNGNGMYAYIDSFREAHKVLIDQMSGSLETIAKDVKIQIEFNPGEVKSYRLIGYENRVLAAKDFANDKKDAGEIGAGHTVTALYELELAGGAQASTTGGQILKYQEQPISESPNAEDVGDEGYDGEILTLALRYKKPDENESRKIEFQLSDEPTSFSSASSDFQFAAAVASFGMLLRNSQHRGTTSFDWVEATATRCVGDDVAGHRIEFLDLVRKAAMRR